MKLNFTSHKISHLFALSAAFIVHAGIVLASLLPSDPVVLNKQTIQVSFVAPSAQNSRSDNFSRKEFVLNIEKKNSLKSLQQNQNEGEKQSIAGKETSGRVDPNAIATRSAESEPVFDADYLNNPAPLYPTLAKQNGMQGKVLLNVVVKIDGTPANVEISRSSGHSSLDFAALDAVKQWRFIPAKRSGQAVEANVIVPVEFKII